MYRILSDEELETVRNVKSDPPTTASTPVDHTKTSDDAPTSNTNSQAKANNASKESLSREKLKRAHGKKVIAKNRAKRRKQLYDKMDDDGFASRIEVGKLCQQTLSACSNFMHCLDAAGSLVQCRIPSNQLTLHPDNKIHSTAIRSRLRRKHGSELKRPNLHDVLVGSGDACVDLERILDDSFDAPEILDAASSNMLQLRVYHDASSVPETEAFSMLRLMDSAFATDGKVTYHHTFIPSNVIVSILHQGVGTIPATLQSIPMELRAEVMTLQIIGLEFLPSYPIKIGPF